MNREKQEAGLARRPIDTELTNAHKAKNCPEPFSFTDARIETC
jgi:hypothetical protein